MGIFSKEWWKESNRKSLEKVAESKFQAREKDGNIWFVFNGEPIAPFSIITKNGTTEEIIGLLETLRKLFVEKNV